MSKVKRAPKNQATLAPGDISAIVFAPRSAANKNLPVGPELKKQPGVAIITAIDASTGISIPPGSLLSIYNNGALAWVTMSQSAIGVAPSGLATGIPLKANDWTYLSMGENGYIRTSAATVGVYVISDETTMTVIPEDDNF